VALVKITSMKGSAAAAKAISYAVNPHKTDMSLYSLRTGRTPTGAESGYAVRGRLCSPHLAADEFRMEEAMRGPGSSAAYGRIMLMLNGFSTEPGELLEIANEIAAEQFPGKQCVMAVHMNTRDIHCHMVVSGIPYMGGEALTEKDFRSMGIRRSIYSILARHGKTRGRGTYENRDSSHGANASVRALTAAGCGSEYNIARLALRKAAEASSTKEEFLKNLKLLGYGIMRKYQGGIVVKALYSGTVLKMSDDINDFGTEEIEKEIEKFKPDAGRAAYEIRHRDRLQYSMPVRQDRLRGKTDLISRYSLCLEELGMIPCYQRYDYLRVPIQMRRAIVRSDRLSEQLETMEKLGIRDLGEARERFGSAQEELKEVRREIGRLRSRIQYRGRDEDPEDIKKVESLVEKRNGLSLVEKRLSGVIKSAPEVERSLSELEIARKQREMDRSREEEL
jgi:hypothetical protein